MNREKVRELFRKRTVKIGSVVLAAAVVFTSGVLVWNNSRNAVPELVTFVDTEGDVEIPGEEVPLGVPKVTKSTKTTKKTKKIKLKSKSKKTYVQTKSSKKTSTKTQKSGGTTTTTVTVKDTDVKDQFKKGSNIKTQVTTEKTTITKTVLVQDSGSGSSSDPVVSVSVGQTAAAEAAAAASVPSGSVAVNSVASGADGRVLSAFNSLGFKVNINSGVSYSGLFDARTQSITLKKADATVYHELGHFLAFIAGNYDRTAEFQAIFNREKSLYTAYNKAYVLSNSSEYFAESFKNYTMDPGGLQSSRPETYGAIQKALSKVTDSQVNNIKNVYGSIWGA